MSCTTNYVRPCAAGGGGGRDTQLLGQYSYQLPRGGALCQYSVPGRHAGGDQPLLIPALIEHTW
jgi:hypothetical protein